VLEPVSGLKMLRLAVLAVGAATADRRCDRRHLWRAPSVTLWLLGAGGVITAGTVFEPACPLQAAAI